jgi:hypothetical protein
MKKTFLALAFGLAFTLPTFAQNQQAYTAVCVDINTLAELVTEFGENASLTMTSTRERKNGELVQIPTVLFINYETKTWSLVERPDRNRYCVIATGEDVKPYAKK